jgi:dihydroorotase
MENKIIDLNILPKDGRVTTSSIQNLSKKLIENNIIGYMMPQLPQPINNDSQLTLLETLSHQNQNVKLYQVITGVSENKLTEIATFSSRISAIFIQSNTDLQLLKVVFQYAQMLNLPIICKIYSGDEVVFESENSFKLGIVGRDRLTERIETDKIIEMAKYFKVPVLFQGVTDIEAIQKISQAKENGVDIFIELSIHHLIYNDEVYFDFNSFMKIDPPFQTENNRKKLLDFVQAGKIDMLTSLHREISDSEKSGSFQESQFGMEGLNNLPKLYDEVLIKTSISSKTELKKMTSINQKIFLKLL